MIKLIIFDLDGVLIDSKKIHFNALNQALEKIAGKTFVISFNDHITKYDGMSTKTKLSLLSEEKHLPIHMHGEIQTEKQKLTREMMVDELSNLDKYKNVIDTINELRQLGYKLYCASNAVTETVKMVMDCGAFKFDQFFSNELVHNPKPHSEIYLRCMIYAGVNPNETLIIEDSPTGLKAANLSGAHVIKVNGPQDISTELILGKKKQDINILIPMAGAGNRFKEAGYTFPKPLISAFNKPLIQLVVENININGHYIFICQKEHYEKYNLECVLNLIAPNCDIIQVDGITEGAACTTLLAKELINNNKPLIIANSDQYVEWDSESFLYSCSLVDAGILTFENNHPKWSYAKLNEDGFVCEVAEKKPISNLATVGIYYWKNGSDYVKYAEQMIQKNIRVNNEFYVCPVFNEAINDGKRIKTFNADKMYGLGTPEDLQYFLQNSNIND